MKGVKIKYPNITLFAGSIILAVILSKTGAFESLEGLGKLGYLGTFLAGLLWPFTFAAPLAAASFFYLGQTISVWLLVLIASAGALITDLLISRLFKGGIFTEFEEIWKMYEQNRKRRFTKAHKPHLINLFHARPFHFISLFTGIIILFSPLPDEIGLEMLSYYKLSPAKLAVLSLASSAVAIWLVVSAGRLALG